ncbi:MAG: hypothetical protein WBA46_15515 [Thermomicrobiales bacterium]
MDVVILLVLAVIIVNLAFVVAPARELRALLLLPRRREAPATIDPAQPVTPVEPNGKPAARRPTNRGHRADVSMAAMRGERRPIILRSMTHRVEATASGSWD